MLKDHIIDSLYLILLVLTIIDAGILFRTMCTSSSNKKAECDCTPCWQDKFQYWICLFAGILFLIVFLYFIGNSKFKSVLVILTFSYILRQVAIALPNAEEIAYIVFGRNNEDWNVHNFYALISVSILFTYLHFNLLPQKLGSLIQPFLCHTTQEWLSVLLFCVSLSLLIFLIVSIGIFPLKLLARFCHTASKKIENFINGPCQKVNILLNKPLCSKSLAILLIINFKSCRLFKKIIRLICFPFAFLYDIVKTSMQIISSIFIGIVWYIICIFSYINAFSFKITEYIANASEKSFIVVAFRICLILGICITVIVNRYEPFFANPEIPSAIIEFIASVILIPVVLEWIMSIRK